MTVSRRQFLTLAGAGAASLAYQPAGASSPVVVPFDRIDVAAPRTACLHAVPRVVIAGIGGAGCHLSSRTLHGRVGVVDHVAIDRDEQVLTGLPADIRLMIGPQVPRGLDCGGRPEDGRAAMEERAHDLARILTGADLVLLVAGMGGGTATGGAPVVARLARAAGALTIAVVTRPFGFEGRSRNRRAAAGIRDLARLCDATVVVANERILDMVGSNVTYRDALAQIDDAVGAGVRALARMVTVPGMVCVGLEDIHASLRGHGTGALGIGSASGSDRAAIAAARALACPLLGDTKLSRVGGVVLRMAAAHLTWAEVQRASEIVWEAVGDVAVTVVSDDPEPCLDEALRVTVVAAGGLVGARG